MNWMKNTTSLLYSYTKFNVMKTTVRYRTFAERKNYIRRHGYESKLLENELLPRHKNAEKLVSLPTYTPKNSWSEKRALFGQNDYIDILGNDKIKPIDAQTQIPPWLRGFKGNEFQMLLRKRIFFQHWKKIKPTKWENLNKRIFFLYKKLNRKTKTGFQKKIGYDC